MGSKPDFIRADGSILVKPGDTIGKYCIAIHGRIDTSKFNEYLHVRNIPHRANAPGEKPAPKQPLTNVNLIFAGETLYHAPSMPVLAAPVPPPPQTGGELPKLPNGDYDVERIMAEYQIPSERYDALREFLQEKRKAQATVAFIGVFVEFAGFLAFATPIAGVLLGFIASIIAITDARNAEINYSYMRGVVYGSVAWIYGEPSPGLPTAIQRPLMQSGIPEDLQLHKQAWQRGLRAGEQQMRNVCAQNNYDVEGFKAAMRVFARDGTGFPADENKRHLAASTLVQAAEQKLSRRYDRQQFLFPYSYYPHDSEHGYMPTYRADVAAKYAALT